MKKVIFATLSLVLALSNSKIFANDTSVSYWTIRDYVREFKQADLKDMQSEGFVGLRSQPKYVPIPRHLKPPPAGDIDIKTRRQAAAYLNNRLTDKRSGNIYLPLPKAQKGDARQLKNLGGMLANLFDESKHLLPIKIGGLSLSDGVLGLNEGSLRSELKFIQGKDGSVHFTHFSQELSKEKQISFPLRKNYTFVLNSDSSLKAAKPQINFSIHGIFGGDGMESFSANIKSVFRPYSEQPGRVARVARMFLKGFKK